MCVFTDGILVRMLSVTVNPTKIEKESLQSSFWYSRFFGMENELRVLTMLYFCITLLFIVFSHNIHSTGIYWAPMS